MRKFGVERFLFLLRPYCWLKGHVTQNGVMHCLMLDWSSKWFRWVYCKRCAKTLVPVYEVNIFTREEKQRENQI